MPSRRAYEWLSLRINSRASVNTNQQQRSLTDISGLLRQTSFLISSKLRVHREASRASPRSWEQIGQYRKGASLRSRFLTAESDRLIELALGFILLLSPRVEYRETERCHPVLGV